MKNKKYLLCIVIVFISLIMCFGYISGHYSTDDYNIMNIGYHTYSVNNNLIEGRPIMYLIDQLFLKLNLSYNIFIISTVVIAILLTDLNILLLYNLIKDKFKKTNKVLLTVILFTTIFNFMYIENLYYVESIVMSLSLVLYTLSAKYFFKEGKKNLLIAILLSILATLSYNGFECYYIVIITLLSLLSNKKINKKVFIDILKAGFIIILSVLLNYVQITICSNLLDITNNRITTFSPLYNILYIITHVPYLIVISSCLYPKYLFVIGLAFLLGISYYYDYKKNQNKLLRENGILVVICITSCYCISIVSLSSFGTGRLSYGVGMTTGIILLNILYKLKEKKRLYKIIVCFCILWSTFNVLNYFNRTMLSKKNNEFEKKEVMELDNYLKKFEIENNTEVKKIAFVFPPTFSYKSIIDVDALRTYWSSIGVIKFYIGRSMEEVRLSEEDNNKYYEIMNDKTYYIENDLLFISLYDW